MHWGRLSLALSAFIYIGYDIFAVVDFNTHLFWTITKPHYAITISVKSPEGTVYTAEGVLEAVYFSATSFDDLLPPLGGLGPGPPRFGRLLEGEALTLPLPGGAVLCMLLGDGYYLAPGKSTSSIWDLADQLLEYDRSSAPKMLGTPFLDAYIAKQVSGSSVISPEKLPEMFIFTNKDDPYSARWFDPEHSERNLPEGYTLETATIAVTGASVTFNAKLNLPWLAKYVRDVKITDRLTCGTDEPTPICNHNLSKDRGHHLYPAQIIYSGGSQLSAAH